MAHAQIAHCRDHHRAIDGRDPRLGGVAQSRPQRAIGLHTVHAHCGRAAHVQCRGVRHANDPGRGRRAEGLNLDLDGIGRGTQHTHACAGLQTQARGKHVGGRVAVGVQHRGTGHHAHQAPSRLAGQGRGATVGGTARIDQTQGHILVGCRGDQAHIACVGLNHRFVGGAARAGELHQHRTRRGFDVERFGRGAQCDVTRCAQGHVACCGQHTHRACAGDGRLDRHRTGCAQTQVATGVDAHSRAGVVDAQVARGHLHHQGIGTLQARATGGHGGLRLRHATCAHPVDHHRHVAGAQASAFRDEGAATASRQRQGVDRSLQRVAAAAHGTRRARAHVQGKSGHVHRTVAVDHRATRLQCHFAGAARDLTQRDVTRGGFEAHVAGC